MSRICGRLSARRPLRWCHNLPSASGLRLCLITCCDVDGDLDDVKVVAYEGRGEGMSISPSAHLTLARMGSYANGVNSGTTDGRYNRAQDSRILALLPLQRWNGENGAVGRLDEDITVFLRVAVRGRADMPNPLLNVIDLVTAQHFD
jgi:hypothetical protein